MAKDVVCGMEVDENTAAAKIDYKGGIYYFCAPGCLQTFLENPEKYLTAKPAHRKHEVKVVPRVNDVGREHH